VRPGAVTVAAEIRKDHAVALLGQGSGGAVLELLLCRGDEAMEQYHAATVFPGRLLTLNCKAK
jgi:hypothetical protein